jgi:hypothetical protein
VAAGAPSRDSATSRGTEIGSSNCLEVQALGFCWPHLWRTEMRLIALLFWLWAGTCSYAIAQSASGSGGSSAGASGASGTTLSNGSTISGTGGTLGPNTSNVLNRGTTGNKMGAPVNDSSGSAASHNKAVNTPAASAATQSLGNTDTGILEK